MNFAIQQINSQLQNAYKEFPSIQQESQFDFKIIFPSDPNSEYKVALTQNYPNEIPLILRNGDPISTPLTDKWSSAFELVHIFQHLSIRASTPQVPIQTVNTNEIRAVIKGAPVNQISTVEGRRAIIENSPSYKSALEIANQAREEKQQNEQGDSNAFNSIDLTLSKINDLYHENKRLNEELQKLSSNSPSINQQLKQQKISELREKEAQINSQIQDLHGQCYTQKTLNFEDFLKQVLPLKEQQSYYSLLIKKLESSKI